MDRKLMDFNNWALNEASNSTAKELLDTVENVVGDRYGKIYIVPDFETFERPDEPKQKSILFGTSSGKSFALNFAGDKFYSIDFWDKDDIEPNMTVYAGDNDVENVLRSAINEDNTNEDNTREEPLVLQIEDDDDGPVEKKPDGKSIKATKKPRTKKEFDKDAVAAKVVPSVSKDPAKRNPEMKTKYEYQDPDTIFDDLRIYTNMVIDGTQPSMLITGMPGVGKCHRRGDKMLMFDMSFKNVEDIIEGDLLMGDDSLPRTVITLGSGRDDMYEIKPIKGESMFVNKDHVLCLVNTRTNIISEVSVIDFLNWPARKRTDHKLYRVGLEFYKQEVKIDPYWLGLWLGDGSSNTAGITISNIDDEILDYHTEYCEDVLELEIHESKIDLRGNDNCRVYTPVRKRNYEYDNVLNKKFNPLMEKLRSYGLSGYEYGTNRKFIPIEYLRNDRETRLQLLAGLLDSDGHRNNNGCYDITQKNKRLAKDITKLARSLGYFVRERDKKCSIKSIGFSGIYYQNTISGAHNVPCKLSRKQSTDRRQIKNVLRTGFKVISIGRDDYYGFTLNGNGRYLMQDFVVTHNTWNVEQEMKKAGLVKNEDYIHVKGKATAAGMYQVLWENNGKLIIFDDMDSIFKDDNAVNILKGALDSDEVREISWLSARVMKTPEGKIIPQKFDFDGRVIFISNLAQKDVDPAIKSRSFVIEIALSPEDMVSYIESLFAQIMPYERVSTKRYALDAIKEAEANNPKVKINMRTFIKAVRIVKNVPDKVVANRMIIQQCSYK